MCHRQTSFLSTFFHIRQRDKRHLTDTPGSIVC